MTRDSKRRIRETLAKAQPVLVACLALAAQTAPAADEPGSSERFREAMSICTMPGPDLAPRLERLSETGWERIEPQDADAEAFRDAAFIRRPPDRTAPETWPEERAETPAVIPDMVFRNGSARLGVYVDAPEGGLGCVLAMLTSADSDLLFDDLAEAGAVTKIGPVRTAAMATTVFDSPTGDWRTEIDLAAAETQAAEKILGDPLAATFSAMFQSQERE